ncbi:MAG: phospho-N-acetylmuramoyl-pentapeptide-transferase, partial [Longimicrobiales bacterium]
MLYHLLAPLASEHILFNLFTYITFRVAGATATALLIAFFAGPPIIRQLRRLRLGQVVRTEGPETHLAKAGTPTMGGVLIIVATAIATLLWADLGNAYVIIPLAVLVCLGALGFLDDYLKVVRRRTEGLVGQYKLTGQGLLGVIVGVYLLRWPVSTLPTNITSVPFLAEWHLWIWPPLFVGWVMFIVAGSSNAVNLT